MPNYILVSNRLKDIFLLLTIFLCTTLYAQEVKKKTPATNTSALEKIAWQKTNEFATDVKLTPLQKKKIKACLLQETIAIDSLKYMPPDFFEDPMKSRAFIIDIKRKTEEQINSLLTEEQRTALTAARENKRKQALRRLQEHNQKHKAQ